jgi:hypothetical protein
MMHPCKAAQIRTPSTKGQPHQTQVKRCDFYLTDVHPRFYHFRQTLPLHTQQLGGVQSQRDEVAQG